MKTKMMKKKGMKGTFVSLTGFALCALLVGGCGSDTRKRPLPGASGGGGVGNVTVAVTKGDNDELVRFEATSSSGTFTIVRWELNGTRRDNGNAQPITTKLGGGDPVGNIATNPLTLNTTEYGLGAFSAFSGSVTVRFSGATSDQTFTFTSGTIFANEPTLFSTTATISTSTLPGRLRVILDTQLGALTGQIGTSPGEDRVQVLVEQVSSGGNAVQITNSNLGAGDISGQFVIAETEKLRVTYSTPSGQDLQFSGPIVVEYTAVTEGATQTIEVKTSQGGLNAPPS